MNMLRAQASCSFTRFKTSKLDEQNHVDTDRKPEPFRSSALVTEFCGDAFMLPA